MPIISQLSGSDLLSLDFALLDVYKRQRHHRTAVQLADDPSAQAGRNAEVRAAGGDFTCTVSDLRGRRGE